MKFRAVGVALTLSGLLLAVAPGMAHHEILAKFDDTKPLTLKGIVTLVDWANPHVHVFMNVAGGKELVVCSAAWSNERWPLFGLEEFPDLEAVQRHTQMLMDLNLARYIDSRTTLGTQFTMPE